MKTKPALWANATGDDRSRATSQPGKPVLIALPLASNPRKPVRLTGKLSSGRMGWHTVAPRYAKPASGPYVPLSCLAVPTSNVPA